MAMCNNCGATSPPTAESCTACGQAMPVVRAPEAAPGGAYAGGTVPRPVESDFDHNVLVTAAAGTLVGLDVRSGQIVWWNQLAQPHESVYGVSIHGRLVFALSGEGRLFCIDYPTGRTLWTAPASPGESARVLVEATFVFLAHREQVDCYNMHGWRLWTQRVPGFSGVPTLALPGKR